MRIQHLLLLCKSVLIIDQVDESVLMGPELRIQVNKFLRHALSEFQRLGISGFAYEVLTVVAKSSK